MVKIRLTYIFSIISMIFLITILFFIQKRESKLVIKEEEIEKVPFEEEIIEGKKEKESFMGVYVKGEKIGYVETKEIPKIDGYEINQRMVIEVIMLGEKKVVSAQTIVNTDKDFRLRNFDFILNSPDQKISLKGERIGTKLKIYYKDREEEIELGETAFLPVTLEAFLKEKEIKKGEKISFKMFDPSVKQVADAILFYKGEEKIDYKNKKIKASLYEYEFAGITQRIYIKDGEIIKEELPFDMVLLKEDKREAIKISEKPIDLLFKYAVKPTGKKINLNAKRILYTISNINPEILDLEFGNQKLMEKGNDYAIVEVKKPEIEFVKEINLSEDLKKYLGSSLFVQPDNKEIRDSAKKWAKGEDFTQKSKILLYKVYNYLSKEPSVTIPSAIEVLNSKKGDCNEHSILYASLLRSIEIPCEIVVGLIYQEGFFWYHAWNVVYLNKWIFVDPTYSEFPASPLHIMLKIGEIEKQAEIAPIVGKIKIEVLEID